MIRAGLVNQKAKSARDRREEQNATDQNISIRQYGRKPKVHMHESLIFIHAYIHTYTVYAKFIATMLGLLSRHCSCNLLGCSECF